MKSPSRSEELGFQPWICLQGSPARPCCPAHKRCVRLTTSQLLGWLELKSQIITSDSQDVAKSIIILCWWEWKMVQLLWKTVWRFLKQFNIELP